MSGVGGNGNAPKSRDELASARDQRAADRDREAALRDTLAEVATAQIEQSEREAAIDSGTALGSDDLMTQARRARERAAADRATAAAQRAASARDRENAAHDRRLAADDRAQAAAERAAAGRDDLTGALRRGVGLTALQREVDRAHRTKQRLVFAFVDVDRLKVVNDTQGHLAGDRLLVRTADLIRKYLRPYDVMVRVGGDEFVCSLSDVRGDRVRKRFGQVSADLAAGPGGGWISVGIAELEPGDSLDDVVGRADAALLVARGKRGYRSRRLRRPSR